MKVEIVGSSSKDAHIIKNLYPLYLHDISAFDGAAPNKHGLIGEAEDVATLTAQGEVQNVWWKRPQALFPYLILADGRPAGFNFIAARPCLPKGLNADFVVHEFFVVHAYRGKGVAEEAAVQGFDKHMGTWEVVTYPSQSRAIAFWRKVIGKYTGGNCSETTGDHPWGVKVMFQFDNRGKP